MSHESQASATLRQVGERPLRDRDIQATMGGIALPNDAQAWLFMRCLASGRWHLTFSGHAPLLALGMIGPLGVVLVCFWVAYRWP